MLFKIVFQTDNGPQFISEEITKFYQANGVNLSRCSPYHPLSNGAVEPFVCTFKQTMKVEYKTDFQWTSTRELPHVLPNNTTCYNCEFLPVISFWGDISASVIDLLKPDLEKRSVISKQFRKLIMIHMLRLEF